MRSDSITLSSVAPRSGHWLGPLLLFCVAITVSSIGLEHVPATDEAYTMLAAQGWAATSAPVIADGLYDRAQLYTVLVGSLFRVFGDSLIVARLFSVVSAGLLVLVVFLWTRRVAGALAAWIAGLLLCFSPLHIYISQFARFYALFGLVFWLGAIGVYYLAENPWAKYQSGMVALGSGLCLIFSLHLQILTGIGLLGLAIWLVYTLGWSWLSAEWLHRRRWALFVGVGATAIVVLLALVYTGVAAEVWGRYRATPAWNTMHRDEFWFYHVYFNQYFQSLWPIFPFLAIVAVAARPRPAVFCFVTFCTALLVLSFGGMKDRRYVFFILPFLFVLWGIALAELLPLVRRYLGPSTLEALSNIAPGAARPWVQRGVITMGLLFLIAANGAPMKTIFGVAGINLFADGSGADFTTSPMRGDWQAAREELSPWLESVDVILTTQDVETLYFLGRFDFALSRNRVSELGGVEFVTDPRTGRVAISERKSVEKIIDCFDSGLIMADAARWDESVSEETSDFIKAHTLPIELPPASEIIAFRWDHPAARRHEKCDLPP